MNTLQLAMLVGFLMAGRENGVLQRGMRIPCIGNRDRIYTKIRLAGHEAIPLWVTVDTGAATSRLDCDIASALGLSIGAVIPRQDSIVANGAGATPPGITLLAPLCVSLSSRDLPGECVGLVLTMYVSPLERDYFVSGILGGDFLGHFVVEIDASRPAMTLYDPDHFTYQGTGAVVDLMLDNGYPHVKGAINETLKGRFFVDTGYYGCGVLFSKSYVTRHKLLDWDSLAMPSKGIERTGTIASFRVGSFFVEHLKVCVIDYPSPLEIPSLIGTGKRLAGNIGTEFLFRGKLILDYPHKRMILESPATLP